MLKAAFFELVFGLRGKPSEHDIYTKGLVLYDLIYTADAPAHSPFVWLVFLFEGEAGRSSGFVLCDKGNVKYALFLFTAHQICYTAKRQ